MAINEIWISVADRIEEAQSIYGDYASTHEALGVALEEWNELQSSIHSNKMESVMQECLDLAAVLVKLVDNIAHGTTAERSTQNEY